MKSSHRFSCIESSKPREEIWLVDWQDWIFFWLSGSKGTWGDGEQKNSIDVKPDRASGASIPGALRKLRTVRSSIPLLQDRGD